jgi:hypothetical protein
MNTASSLEVRLKGGLSAKEIQDTFNELCLFGYQYGIRGVEPSPSRDDVLWCDADETSAVDAVAEIRNLPTVASVVPGEVARSFVPERP